MKVENLVNDLPQDEQGLYIEEGLYYHPDLAEDPQILSQLVFAKDGNLLLSRVELQDRANNPTVFNLLKDGKTSSKNWFNKYIAGDLYENIYVTVEQRLVAGKVKEIFHFDSIRSLFWKTGNRLTVFIQDVDTSIFATGPFEPSIRGVPLSKGIKRQFVITDSKFEEHINYNFISFNALENLKQLYTLASIQIANKETNSFLPLSNYYLKVLNSKKIGGRIQLGYRYNEIEYILQKLIPSIKTINYDQDNFIYKLFSISLRSDKPDGQYAIQNMGLRKISKKEFLNNWLTIY